MEQYIKTKPAAFLHNPNSYKPAFWIGLLVLSIQHSNENWPVFIGLAISILDSWTPEGGFRYRIF